MTTSRPMTVAATFSAFADGSGAEAVVRLRNGVIWAITFFNGTVKTHTPGNWATGRHGAGGKDGHGYGRAAGLARWELARAVKEFEAKIAALGPEWSEKNRALYSTPAA